MVRMKNIPFLILLLILFPLGLAAADESDARGASPTEHGVHASDSSSGAGHEQGGHGHGGHGYGGGSAAKKDLSVFEEAEADLGITSLWDKLVYRAKAHPFNLIATVIFFLAVLHTFFASTFMKIAHRLEHEHRESIERSGRTAGAKPYQNAKDDTSFWATVFHFLGEVEAVFGIWCVPLLVSMLFMFGWDAAVGYVDTVHFTEPLFVVVIMAIASTKPVLRFAEAVLGSVASLGGKTPLAWWLSILTIAPLLGSFITEPAAMTIAALLVGHQLYRLDPSPSFKYATLGLLFVNVSVGGTLTHFAAPPVLMVAGRWGFDIQFMFTHFGWKAMAGIVVANLVYMVAYRKEFVALKEKAKALAANAGSGMQEEPIPAWVTAVVLGFMAWTVATLHHPPLFIGGFLFFLAFVQATDTHQDDVSIKNPMLVGFFLAGLVTHGGLQQWWIAPVLSSLGEFPLFVGATVLTAFNDNAAITFLASQVPVFDAAINPSPEAARALQYAVVAGAVTGGGLTVIANAPNPAGQALLRKFFDDAISPLWLAVGALVPTLILGTAFMVL